MTTKSDAKQRKEKRRQRKREKRLEESKGKYYRRELPGGCVVLQSDYWLARADRPHSTISETFEPEPAAEPISPVPSDSKERWLAELAYVARQCGFKDGWVAHHFKARFGEFPPWEADIKPMPPSDEVKAWVKARRAEYLATKKAETAV